MQRTLRSRCHYSQLHVECTYLHGYVPCVPLHGLPPCVPLHGLLPCVLLHGPLPRVLLLPRMILHFPRRQMQRAQTPRDVHASQTRPLLRRLHARVPRATHGPRRHVLLPPRPWRVLKLPRKAESRTRRLTHSIVRAEGDTVFLWAHSAGTRWRCRRRQVPTMLLSKSMEIQVSSRPATKQRVGHPQL